MPKLFKNFEEILSHGYGNFEEKSTVFEPSIKNCLNTNSYCNTVIAPLTSDPANEFFG